MSDTVTITLTLDRKWLETELRVAEAYGHFPVFSVNKDTVRAALDAQEVPHEALEPVGEEPNCTPVEGGFSCSGIEESLKAEAARINAQIDDPDDPSWASISGADAYRRSQGNPVPVTVRCRECGAPEGAHHGPDCVTGNSRKTRDRIFSRPVTAADCQPEDERESTEEPKGDEVA